MFDLIKPNREWRNLSEEYNGKFKKGNIFISCKMILPYKTGSYAFETAYSGDNFWRGQTIVIRNFHFLQEFKLTIKPKYFTGDENYSYSIKLDKNFATQEQVIRNLASLNNLQKEIKWFKIEFMTEGIIAKDYEVLPVLKFKCNGYVVIREQINLILAVLHDLSTILEKEKIIKSSA